MLRIISESYELGNALRLPADKISRDFGIYASAARRCVLRIFALGIGKLSSSGDILRRVVCVRFGGDEFQTWRYSMGR